MNAEGVEILRQLLERTDPKPEPEPEHKPLRWRRRREAHRCYMRFAPGRPTCR